MSFTRWLSDHLVLSSRPASRRKTPAARPIFRPTLEALEDRWVPSTLTVRNNLDSGAYSLRAVIAAARSNDTIVFAPSLVGQTITLTSGELLINKNLTIAGPSDRNLTVSGNNASRVFEVAKTVRAVTLSGLTISNGSATGPIWGGGILNHGTLTISNSSVSNNTANNDGGGIYSDGVLTVSSSTLSMNYAGFSGGGISNFGKLTVSGSTLSGNSAAQGGGGIENQGTATVSGSTLSGNSAVQGGGIYDGSGTLTVSSSTLSGNSAVQGGGIYNYHGVLTVSGSTLSGNVASSSGGGIYVSVAFSATVTVKNSSSITGNTAPVGFGADVYNLGVLYLDSTSRIGILDGNPAVLI